MAEKSKSRLWLENYWYHYKWHTIIGLFLAFTLVVGVAQCASRPTYDQEVILYCDRVIPENTALALELELGKVAGDLNGDGEALLGVYNLSYDSNGVNPQNGAGYANSQKLPVLVSSEDYLLYVVDEYGYTKLTAQDNMKLFETYDFLPDKEGTAWNWKGSPLQKTLAGSRLPEDLYFCIRKVTKQESKPQAEDAANIIQALMEHK